MLTPKEKDAIIKKYQIHKDDTGSPEVQIAILTREVAEVQKHFDSNGNGKADRTLGMMPREGFGFSRDAKVRMGPPRFEEAVFEVSDSPKAMAIRMRYMF